MPARTANVLLPRRQRQTLLLLEPVHATAGVEEILLAPGRRTIGASSRCDVVLDVPGIAAEHCRLITGPRRTEVEALDRRTWLNDGPAAKAVLKPGDRLVLGPVEFRVECLPLDERSEAAQAWRDIVRCDRAGSAAIDRVDLAASAEGAVEHFDPPRALDLSLVKEREVLEAELEALRTRHSEQEAALAAVQDRRRTADDDLERSQAEAARLRAQGDRRLGDAARREALLAEFEEALAAEACGLVERHGELERLTAALASREAAIDSDAARLDVRADELEWHAAALTDRATAIDSDAARLDARADELERRAAALSDRETAIESNTARLDARVDELERRAAALTERETAIDSNAARLDARANELERRESELDSRRAELDTRQAAFNERCADTNRSSAETATATDTREQEDARRQMRLALAARLTELARLEEALSGRRRTLDERAAALEATKQELQRRDAEIQREAERLKAAEAEQRTDLACCWRELDERQAALDARYAALNKQSQALDAERNAHGAERRALEERHQELNAREAELERMIQAQANFADHNDDALLVAAAVADESAQSDAFGWAASPSPRRRDARATLAEIFDLPTSTEIFESASESDFGGDAESASTERGRAALSPSENASDASAGLERQIEPPAATDAADEEDDPIAAYMRQLLGRTRGCNANNADDLMKQRPQEPEPFPPARSTTADSAWARAERPLEEPADRDPGSSPRRKPDVASAREGLDSLREIANLSARTAVSTYAWRQYRGKLVIGSCLSAGSAALAAALFGGWIDVPGAAQIGWAAAGATGAALFELSRAVWGAWRARRFAKS
ncbi:MAG: hypothetical protein KY476_14300 [Planctomycetes bacterium]|nr:hypothetical protein [Planctomycetota bacterium]